MKKILAPAALLALLATSCKKQDVAADLAPSAPSFSALKDSALGYTKDLYLWYSQIPTSFSTSSYNDLNALMTGIRQYSTEPGFSNPVDRWSFAIAKSEWDKTSSGVAGDFGMDVFFKAEGDLRVRLVEPGSPAGLAGIRRGWRITGFNGSSNISTSNSTNIVNAVWKSSQTNFSFAKPDGNTVSLTLNAATYLEHPIIVDTVYQQGNRSIGYFSFNSFLGDTTQIYQGFSKAFNRYASAGVQDLIVDLRYNGGGYVSVQEKLANWLAPAAANGQLMMKQQYNDKYSQYNESTLFRKLGSLNLSRIFFIVSSNTASASELLINNLKPFLDVKLIGPSRTYGKPVGFFPITVGDQYIFPVSFRSTNKNNEGNYFDGMALQSQVADGLDKDWGDVNESCLQSALAFINTGVFRTGPLERSASVQNGNDKLSADEFKGAIDARH